MLPVLVRSNLGFSNGSGLPLSSARRGFGSNVSTCDGPPDMNRKMTRFAFAGDGGGLTVSGFDFPSANTQPIKSSDNNPARPSIPNPLANRRNIWRRFSGWRKPPSGSRRFIRLTSLSYRRLDFTKEIPGPSLVRMTHAADKPSPALSRVQ